MTPPDRLRVKQIVTDALDLQTEDRGNFVRHSCADDAALLLHPDVPYFSQFADDALKEEANVDQWAAQPQATQLPATQP
jgi:hypothetical protein